MIARVFVKDKAVGRTLKLMCFEAKMGLEFEGGDGDIVGWVGGINCRDDGKTLC